MFVEYVPGTKHAGSKAERSESMDTFTDCGMLLTNEDVVIDIDHLPKESIKAWTEVQKVLLPALSGAMEGMNIQSADEKEHWVNVVASAFQTLPYTLDADKVDRLYSYLLNPEYIAVQRKEDKTPIRLSEDIIDEIFTGRTFDLFFLMAKIVQINYLDFSKLCGLPIGFRENAEQIKHKIMESLAKDSNH
jgi:hypothetical protein